MPFKFHNKAYTYKKKKGKSNMTNFFCQIGNLSLQPKFVLEITVREEKAR